jgi:hypothetical protein
MPSGSCRSSAELTLPTKMEIAFSDRVGRSAL